MSSNNEDVSFKDMRVTAQQFNNLVKAEADRMTRIINKLKLNNSYHASIERRARISVYGRLVADGAVLEGV